MGSFSFTDIILFLGVSQGLFLAASLFLLHNKNKHSNNTLSLILLLASFMLLGRILVYRINSEIVWRVAMVADTLVFLFGPLLLIYVRRLLFQNEQAFRLSYKHYVVAGLHFSYVVGSFFFSVEVFQQLYEAGILKFIWLTVELAGICSFTYYITRSFALWNNYRGRKKFELSTVQNIDTYLLFFLGTLSVFILFWMVSIISYYGFENYLFYINYNSMWICIPVMMYLIGYFSLRQPEIFRMPLSVANLGRGSGRNSGLSGDPSEKNRLRPEEIKQLQKRLHFFMNEEKIFLEPDLTLNGLAVKMNTSSNNLSWLLNQVYQQKFYDYMNAARIQAFIQKLNHGEHKTHTLLALAMDVGFNSKSTFNKVFKAHTKMTPSEYIEQKNVA